MINNPRELRFLVWLSRNPKKHIPQKYYQLDWLNTIKHAENNKIIPFFSHIVDCDSCQKKIPKERRIVLRKRLSGKILTYGLQEKEKNKICRHLSEKKIQVVLLKDIQAYNTRYSKSIFPQKTDIDFFILKPNGQKIKTLKRLMENLGYKTRKRITPEFLRGRFDRLALNYVKRLGPATVAIDFHLDEVLPEGKGKVSPINKEINQKFTPIFTSSISQAKGGKYFLASQELHLLFWCWHFFLRDSCQGLRSLFDIAQICKQNSLDWERMLKIAKELQLLSYFLFVINVAHQVHLIKLPREVLSEIEKDKRVKMALKLYSPSLTAHAESHDERIDKKVNKELKKYFFLIKLILWEKPLIYKIGPRAIFYSFYYLPKVFLELKGLELHLGEQENENLLVGEVKSRSMAPLLLPGVKVKISPEKTSHIKFGDLVCYLKNDKLIVHRFIKRAEGNRLVLKGDNSLGFETVSHSSVIGKVVQVVRGQKTVQMNSARSRVFSGLMIFYSYLKFFFPSKSRFFPGRNFLARRFYDV